MSTFLRTTIVAGLLLLLAGPAQAALVGTNLGTLGVDPLLDGDYQKFGSWHTLEGGGSNIGGTDDHGYFAYEEFAGDGTLIVQVFDFGLASDPLRKGGLMIRDSLDEDAINVANFVLYAFQGPERRIEEQTRAATGGGTDEIPSSAGNRGLTPWIKLERTGNVFEAWWSKNGAVWDPFPAVTVAMDGSIFVGLAVTSHDNSETAAVTFRNLSVVPAATGGFTAAGTRTWGELGNGFWDVAANWDPTAVPDRTTHVLLEDTNSDTVTVRTAAEALSLTVLGGEIAIDGGSSLTVFGSVDFDTDTYLEMDAGTSLTVFGGIIPNMFADKGDVTIETAADLAVSNFDGHGIIAGTLTKEGAGKLQLDNSGVTGQAFADTTTFDVQQGVLASSGADPLGNAMEVILAGGTRLELANNPGGISAATDVTVDGSAEVMVDTTDGAYLGALTLNDDLKTSGAGLGLSFDGTSIPASAVTIYTDIATGLGVLSAPGAQITKDGPDGLGVLSEGDVTGATFDVKAGTLMGVALLSNPFKDANEVVLSGGRLLLANNSGATAVVDTPVRLTAHSTLNAGADGWPFAGPPNVTLGGTNGVTLDGHRLDVGTVDGYTLDIAGALADTGGEVRMTEGTVRVLGGGAGGDLDMRVTGGALSISATPLNLKNLRVDSGELSVEAEVVVGDYIRVYGGLVGTTADVTADDLRVYGGEVNTGTPLTVTDDMKVEGGVMTTNAALQVDDDLEVYGTGTLAMNAAATAKEVEFYDSAQVSGDALVISSYLAQGKVASGAWKNYYSIDSGTFTASGTDMLNAVTLEFGGNKLTVSGFPPPSTAADSSGNGYDGSLVGGSFSSDVPAALAGGRAMDLTGGDDYVKVDTGGTQDVFDLDSMTVAAWVKGAPGDWSPYISKNGEPAGWQMRKHGGDPTLDWTTRGTEPSNGDMAGITGDATDGNWHHVVMTVDWDGATLFDKRIYVDGVLDKQADYTQKDGHTGIADTGDMLVFGARQNGGFGNYLNGMLDDIYIYDRAISDAEVTELFNNSGSIPTSGLVGSWTFNDLTPAGDLTNTDLVVTSNATLEAMAAETVTFGDLEVASGVELELVTEAPYGMSFDDVTTFDGVSILGDMSVRGDLSVGDSPGGLLVSGNLALGDGSVYMWDLEEDGADLITVTGDLDILSDWTLMIRTGESFGKGEHTLFTYGGDLFFDAPQAFDLSEAPGWNASGGRLRVFNRGNDVMLDVVPEPATWILLLTAGVAGLIGVARRRRRA